MESLEPKQTLSSTHQTNAFLFYSRLNWECWNLCMTFWTHIVNLRKIQPMQMDTDSFFFFFWGGFGWLSYPDEDAVDEWKETCGEFLVNSGLF